MSNYTTTPRTLPLQIGRFKASLVLESGQECLLVTGATFTFHLGHLMPNSKPANPFMHGSVWYASTQVTPSAYLFWEASRSQMLTVIILSLDWLSRAWSTTAVD